MLTCPSGEKTVRAETVGGFQGLADATFQPDKVVGGCQTWSPHLGRKISTCLQRNQVLFVVVLWVRDEWDGAICGASVQSGLFSIGLNSSL